ncbi:MAG: DNA translocase FtsK 4TM domain-containing protein [Bacteroidales bacterium]|nr:DNA translocase FtsK 4TM domain-containing protein [Candidatus Cacconaster merdequi]
MASKKTKKKKKTKAVKQPLVSENTSRTIRIVAGVVFAIFTVYTLAALVSYLFTWRFDQSLKFENGIMSNEVTATNSGGKLGFFWAELLVSKLFGFGAFFLPFFLGAITVACFRIRRVNILRACLVSLFGAVLFSVLCSYIFRFTDYRFILKAGAGGSYGYFADEWLGKMTGPFGEGCILFVALFLFVLMFTKKVAFWFDDLLYGVSHRVKTASEDKEDCLAQDSDEEDIANDEEESVQEEGTSNKQDPVRNWRKSDSLYGLDYDSEEETVVFPSGPSSNVAGDCKAEGDEVPLTIEASGDDVLENLRNEEDDHQYDPRLDLPEYRFPSTSLLNDYLKMRYEVSNDELEKNKQRIVNALNSYRIQVVSITAKMGPTVTLYKIHLADGVKIAQVRNLEEDIAISLGAKGVRVVTLLDSVGIEVANEKPSVVALRWILNSPKYKEAKMELPLAMGITVTNEPFFLDLAKMPHLLVAGATGMGKSVGLNVMIASLLYAKHPAEMKLVLVDPKKVELSLYSKLEKHFLAMLPDGDEAIITDTKKVVSTLKSLCIEMDDRYDLLKAADVRQLGEYNQKFLGRHLNPEKGHRFMPYIVVIIDEFADLLMTAGREIEEPIARLAQKARAVGIHLIIATQRPTTNIITGTIKANFNSRIAFKVNSGVDSKTIIDAPGAQRLIGRGDMLVVHPGADLTRVQCALIDTPEIIALVGEISSQRGYSHPFYLPECPDDSDDSDVAVTDLHKRDQLFEECAKMVVQYRMGSTSMFQRKLGIGYARAGRIMDQLEAAGIVGPQDGSKARNVYVTEMDELDKLLESLNHI